MKDCCRINLWIEPYVDGELSPDRVLEVESHSESCPSCAETIRFEHALRSSLKSVVQTAAPEPSAALMGRLRRAGAIERQRMAAASRASRSLPAGSLSWRAVLPLSAAAAAVLVFGSLRSEPAGTALKNTVNEASSAASVSREPDVLTSAKDFLDQLAESYQRSPEPTLNRDPPPVPMPTLAGFSMSAPEMQSVRGVWEGWSQPRSRNWRATSLHYRLGDHRVVVWVYDSQRVPLRIMLEPRVAKNKPVFVGIHEGYSVAAVESHGVGYAATTDLSTSEAADLLASAVH